MSDAAITRPPQQEFPRLITKKLLCIAFDLYSPKTGEYYYNRLRELYMSDSLLKALDIKPEDYRNCKFNYEQSQFIIKYFNMRPEEFEK